MVLGVVNMSYQLRSFCVLLISALLYTCQESYACYVIAAGKNATADGSVLFGHVEQNYVACVLNFRFIPTRFYGPQDTVTFKDGGKIQQVPEVSAFLWTQNIKQDFADGFMNARGVGIYSNQCLAKEDKPQLSDGGIGFNFRRLIAERAKSAREGVHIGGELVERFGYNAPSGRTYTIADADEIWLFAMCRGKHWCAQKVPDDHAIAMPNTYIIREINLQDTVNFLSSPGLIQYAQSRGWYSSGTFIFTDVYGVGYTTAEYDRQYYGQKALTNSVVPYGNTMPFSVKPDKKLTVKDVIKILRDNDNYATQENAVFQLKSGIPREIGSIFWRTTAQGKFSVLTPWYAGIKHTPAYYCKNISIEQQLTLSYHFNPPSGTFSNDPNLVWWLYKGLQDRVQNSSIGQTRVQMVWSEFERRLFNNQPAVEQYATTLFSTNQDSSKSFLTEYCANTALKAKTIAEKMNQTWITGTNTTYHVALACAAPVKGTQPLTVSFDGFGCSNNSITEYTWNFGDGKSDTGSSPLHTYENPGTYIAVLTVKNSAATTDTDSITILVDPSSVDIQPDLKNKNSIKTKLLIRYNSSLTKSVEIHYDLNDEQLPGCVRILTIPGEVIKEIDLNTNHSTGFIRWDGRDRSGKTISRGIYMCCLVLDGRVYNHQKIIWHQ